MGLTYSRFAAASDGGGASSTIVSAMKAAGWHEFKIQCYSDAKAAGTGKFFKSSTFNVGGHNWFIILYPDPSDKYSGWISVYLNIDHRGVVDDNVRTCIKFSLLDQAGRPVPKYTLTCRHTFTATSLCWGFGKFVRRADLESSSYVKEDCLRIRCDVSIFKKFRTETSSSSECAIDVPPPDLQQHLGNLLVGKVVGGDVTFEVGGEEFMAHKYVLAARSPVFKAALFGTMKEMASTRIQINDMEPRVFQAMLQFIYTDSVPDDQIDRADKTVVAQHLLVAADRYGMERLKLVCEDMLCSCMETSTAASTLVLAEQHGCRGLKEFCFRFLKYPGNLNEVMATDGFQHLRSVCPTLLVEILSKVAP
ncbi:hypothetical protein BS78_05G215000 [Paspalum vaginatum]|nr:hypothetical protein BS78_05G215000 [Paspalum vaginatum]